jgi:hypothetical protein
MRMILLNTILIGNLFPITLDVFLMTIEKIVVGNFYGRSMARSWRILPIDPFQENA